MGTRVELSVGGTTDVPSLADQIKPFQPRAFANLDSRARVFDRTAKDNPAREALTQKCVRVIVENFERLPAHDSTEGLTLVNHARKSTDDDDETDEEGTARDKKVGVADPGVITAGGKGRSAAERESVEARARHGEEQDQRQKRGGPRGIPAKFLQAISAGLSTKLDPKVGALYVFDENYWKRRCVEQLGWQECQIAEHGLTWKQLFFEAHVSDRLETLNSQRETFDHLLEFLMSCQEYVFSLRIKQLLAHPDMQAVCSVLPNLAMLDLTYGVRAIGIKYERMLFGMKISDASCIAKAIQATDTLSSLVLQGNLVDDDLMRMLMTGLIRNSTVTNLDVSHNKITNHGARLISKLLGEDSVLAILNLADNQIHAEGGRYLGRALRNNCSLYSLNLRLNRLTDEGGRMLIEGLHDNVTLACLNLSANSLACESCSSLSIVLRQKDKRLATLDLSCNELQDDDIRLLCIALERNSSLTSVDLRMNDVSTDLEELETIEVWRDVRRMYGQYFSSPPHQCSQQLNC